MKDLDLRLNNKNGINDLHKDALLRAQKADLITLPNDIKGTNCFNCRYIINKLRDIGFCNHQKVKQHVNGRMCCALWDNSGSYRPFTKTN